MLAPAYKLTIAGKTVDTTDEPRASTAVDLRVTLDMDTPADSFTLVLGQVGGLAPARDDDAAIELGYADNGGLTRVVTGTVATVTPGLTTSRIIGHSPAQSLLRTFVDKTYEGMNAGKIVADLAGQAGVTVAEKEDGITFPAYVVDGRLTVYHHIRELADLSGFDVYFNADGELIFKKFQGGNTVHKLEYAKHIIEVDVLQSPSPAGKVEAWGESPGGGQAEEAWAWLTKDFSGSKGSAGADEPVALLERPALRTAEAAQAAADAVHTRNQRRTARPRVLIRGHPEIKLGDAVRLDGLPDSGQNGTYQVRSVLHRITKSAGFTTEINLSKV